MPLSNSVNCSTLPLGWQYITPIMAFLFSLIHFLSISINLLSIYSWKMSRSVRQVYTICSLTYNETPPPLRLDLYALPTLYPSMLYREQLALVNQVSEKPITENFMLRLFTYNSKACRFLGMLLISQCNNEKHLELNVKKAIYNPLCNGNSHLNTFNTHISYEIAETVTRFAVIFFLTLVIL